MIINNCYNQYSNTPFKVIKGTDQVNHLDVVEEPQHCHEAVKAFVGVDSFLLVPTNP
jgi:hypothetical protein